MQTVIVSDAGAGGKRVVAMNGCARVGFETVFETEGTEQTQGSLRTRERNHYRDAEGAEKTEEEVCYRAYASAAVVLLPGNLLQRFPAISDSTADCQDDSAHIRRIGRGLDRLPVVFSDGTAARLLLRRFPDSLRSGASAAVGSRNPFFPKHRLDGGHALQTAARDAHG